MKDAELVPALGSDCRKMGVLPHTASTLIIANTLGAVWATADRADRRERLHAPILGMPGGLCGLRRAS